MAEGKKVLENQSATPDELKAAATKITEEFSKVAQDIYGQAGAEGMDPAAAAAAAAAGGTPPPASESKSDDPNVVDADFEVVDDDNKK